MALNKEELVNDIFSLLSDMESRAEDAKEEFAHRLANAIDNYVRSGVVKSVVQAGIPVSTAGTAAAQTGSTTSIGQAEGYIE